MKCFLFIYHIGLGLCLSINQKALKHQKAMGIPYTLFRRRLFFPYEINFLFSLNSCDQLYPAGPRFFLFSFLCYK